MQRDIKGYVRVAQGSSRRDPAAGVAAAKADNDGNSGSNLLRLLSIGPRNKSNRAGSRRPDAASRAATPADAASVAAPTAPAAPGCQTAEFPAGALRGTYLLTEVETGAVPSSGTARRSHDFAPHLAGAQSQQRTFVEPDNLEPPSRASSSRRTLPLSPRPMMAPPHLAALPDRTQQHLRPHSSQQQRHPAPREPMPQQQQQQQYQQDQQVLQAAREGGSGGSLGQLVQCGFEPHRLPPTPPRLQNTHNHNRLHRKQHHHRLDQQQQPALHQQQQHSQGQVPAAREPPQQQYGPPMLPRRQFFSNDAYPASEMAAVAGGSLLVLGGDSRGTRRHTAKRYYGGGGGSPSWGDVEDRVGSLRAVRARGEREVERRFNHWDDGGGAWDSDTLGIEGADDCDLRWEGVGTTAVGPRL